MSEKNSALSRRGFLGLSVKSAVAVAGIGLTAAQGQAAPKLAKSAVSYQDKPKNGQRCDACTYWQGDNACSKVKGNIAAEGWCAMFTPKG